MSEKSLGEEITENKAVQVGGAAVAAGGMASLGLSTTAIGAITTGKAGLLLCGLGPFGLAIGSALIIGGIAVTVSERSRRKKQEGQ